MVAIFGMLLNDVLFGSAVADIIWGLRRQRLALRPRGQRCPGRRRRQRCPATEASAPTLMEGGSGNDTYFVDNGADDVVEGGTGIDTVSTSVSFSIAADALVENLTLTGAAIVGVGNALGNTIQGNAQGATC